MSMEEHKPPIALRVEAGRSSESFRVGAATIASIDHPKRNEDDAFAHRESGSFGVFDGMGGEEGGTTASTFAMNRMLPYLRDLQDGMTPREVGEELRQLIIRTSQELNHSRGEYPGFGAHRGTTATIAKLLDRSGGGKTAVIGHVGDSRAYKLQVDGRLRRITLDDDQVAKRAREGKETRDPATIQAAMDRAHRPEDLTDARDQVYFASRNVLTQVLGQKEDVEPQIHIVHFKPGEKLVLTSDGIHDNLPTDDMEKALPIGQGDPQGEAAALVDWARQRSGDKEHPRAKPDDATSVVVGI